MSTKSIAESRPKSDVPPAIASALNEMTRQFAQTLALVTSARRAMETGNKFMAEDLLDMAEDQLGDVQYLKRVGAFLGVDTARVYTFE